MKKTMLLTLSIILMGVSTISVFAADDEIENQHGDENKVIEKNLVTQEEYSSEIKYNNRSLITSEPALIGTATSLLDSRSIINTDYRYRITNVTSFPYSTFTKLVVKFPGSQKEYGCSGTIVDPNRVITAGHCLYDGDLGGFANSIKVIPGKNASYEPFGSAYAIRTAVMAGWSKYGYDEYDAGVIILNSNIGNKTGELGIISNYQTNNKTVDITGYPLDKAYGTMWKDIGKIVLDNGYLLNHDVDTYGGQSGSSIHVLDSGNGHSMIGIHTDGASGSVKYNGGVKVNSNNFDFLANHE